MKPAILFVDDEVSILNGLKQVLFKRRKSWQMFFADSGREGLRLIEQQPFDVVVSDMRMPGMDGIAFLSQVKAKAPDTVRLMLSGNTDGATASAAVNEGKVFKFLILLANSY